MKRFKKTLHPKRKKKDRFTVTASKITGITSITFPTNEELRREFPELIMYSGGGGLPEDYFERVRCEYSNEIVP